MICVQGARAALGEVGDTWVDSNSLEDTLEERDHLLNQKVKVATEMRLMNQVMAQYVATVQDSHCCPLCDRGCVHRPLRDEVQRRKSCAS